jgi:hypothetical protein
MKPTLTLIPTISINPSKITLFNEILWEPVKPTRRRLILPFFDHIPTPNRITTLSKDTRGKVSKNAKRKMTTALDYLLLMASPQAGTIPKSGKKFMFRIAFITLDLPSQQIHTDNEIKKLCLNSFLLELTRYHNVKNYLWRAEKQKNGNIHFHLIIDKFVLYNVLRKRWNRIVNKLGYVDRYRNNQQNFHADGFRPRPELFQNWPEVNQRKAWLEGMRTNWSCPNSTDIHSCKFIQNLKNYVCKYLTKNEKEKNPEESTKPGLPNQQGRIWGCNFDLSNIKGARLQVDNEISEALKTLIDKTKCQVYSTEYFSVYSINIADLAKFSPSVLFQYFSSYLLQTFNYNSQLFFG